MCKINKSVAMILASNKYILLKKREISFSECIVTQTTPAVINYYYYYYHYFISN